MIKIIFNYFENFFIKKNIPILCLKKVNFYLELLKNQKYTLFTNHV
jgi:hypothetical protein